MDGLLKTDIPSKLSGSRQNLPCINTELKRQIRRKGRRFSKAKKVGFNPIRSGLFQTVNDPGGGL